MTASAFNPQTASVVNGVWTTSLTPLCKGGSISMSSSGVNSASTAYDWFSPTGTAGTAINAMPTGLNKQMASSIAIQAKSSLMPLVKMELFAESLNTAVAVIVNGLGSAKNSLTSMQLNNVDALTKAALTTAATAEMAAISSEVTRLKTLENAAYLFGSDTTQSSNSTSTTFFATPALAATAKPTYFISNLFDPTAASNGGVVALTTGGANSATVLSQVTAAIAAISNQPVVAALNAQYLTAAQNMFDIFCMSLQGFADSVSTTGTVSSSAPVGLYPGIDFELSIGGSMQTTGTCTSGTCTAPTTSTTYW